MGKKKCSLILSVILDVQIPVPCGVYNPVLSRSDIISVHNWRVIEHFNLQI